MKFASTTVMMVGLLSVTALTPPVFAQSFPSGAKYGYIDLQRILTGSTEGQAANAKVQALTDQKLAELEARNVELQRALEAQNAQLQAQQQKLAEGETVMSAEARISLQREIQRMQLDIQRRSQDAQAEMERVTQDAETEVAELRQQLQLEFESKLQPAIDQVATSVGIDFLFSWGQGGLVWANRSLDLTEAVIDRLNAAR